MSIHTYTNRQRYIHTHVCTTCVVHTEDSIITGAVVVFHGVKCCTFVQVCLCVYIYIHTHMQYIYIYIRTHANTTHTRVMHAQTYVHRTYLVCKRTCCKSIARCTGDLLPDTSCSHSCSLLAQSCYRIFQQSMFYVSVCGTKRLTHRTTLRPCDIRRLAHSCHPSFPQCTFRYTRTHVKLFLRTHKASNIQSHVSCVVCRRKHSERERESYFMGTGRLTQSW
jgi:hypothetical protein